MHGMSVHPPTRLSVPSRVKPFGSFWDGICALMSALCMMPLIASCLGSLPAPRRHESPWLPIQSTLVPQGNHVLHKGRLWCGGQQPHARPRHLASGHMPRWAMRAASAHHEGYVWPANESCDKGRCNKPQEPRGHAPPKPDPSISAWIFRGLVEQVVHICLTKPPTHCQCKGQKDSPPAKARPKDPVLLLPRQETRMVWADQHFGSPGHHP